MFRAARLPAVLLGALSCAALFHASGAPVSVALNAQQEGFTLGVLRRDGIVIPFASYSGRRWSSPWPAELNHLELPISLGNVDRRWWGSNVPPPQTVTLWADGQSRGALTLLAPGFVPLRCGRRIGLRTNYHAAEVPPSAAEQPFPKDGLVVAGAQAVGAIASTPLDSPEARAVAAALVEEFDSEESFAASVFANWQHPFSKAQRKKVPIQLEALYHAPMDDAGWTAYYVEAVRKYPPGPGDGGCGPETVVRGWVRTGPKGRRRVDIGAQVTYCDRAGITFMLPLGLVTVGGGTHWVYQLAGYESEGYVIAKPTPGEIERLVAYSAGTCPPWMR